MKAKIVKATTENRQELGKLIPLRTPFTVQMSPTNVCNFRCKYCMHANRPKDIDNIFMDWKLYKKSIDDLTEFPDKLKLLLIAGPGEPLIHKDIDKMVAYAKEKSVAEMVRIITNASCMSHELSDRLIAVGLDHLKISIQGTNDEIYKDMCDSKVPIDRIIDNIEYFYRKKKNTVVNVKIIADALQNEEDEKKFYEMFGDICDVINIEYIAPFQEGVVYEKFLDTSTNISLIGGTSGQESNKICQIPFYSFMVYPDGEVIPCCMLSFKDYKKLSLGNVAETSLFNLWNSDKYNQFRLSLLQDKRKEMPVCCNCNAFQCGCQPGDNIDPYVSELIEKYKTILKL